MYDENNIFAKIIEGTIPCEKIYEDDSALFFKDINPLAKIHILGVPKKPSIDFSDFILKNNSEEIAEFYKKINMVIEMVGIRENGYKIITNSGDHGGQEVPHFHIHILGGEKITFKNL
jgi:histidine triad (HIT) family protein